MKLIIQIPCYNEEATLGITLSRLPRKVAGVDTVEWLIVDDGSNDGTVDVAVKNGVDHVIRHARNQGLARAFMTGINACLALGADVIVNTDADNQYDADDIPKLVRPILDGKADIVIGARPVESIKHFSRTKKLLQKIGSRVVCRLSGTDISDATSGFRAVSRKAALQVNVFSNYTYTLETIIQAGRKGITIASVPIRVNEYLRPSRLVRSIPSYIFQSVVTIARIFIIYKPFRFFMFFGIATFLPGLALGIRYLYFFFAGHGAGHVQSVILSAVLLIIGFQFGVLAFFADLISINRRLLEDIRSYLREREWSRDKRS